MSYPRSSSNDRVHCGLLQSLPFLGISSWLQLSDASCLLHFTDYVVGIHVYAVVPVSKGHKDGQRISKKAQIVCLVSHLGVSHKLRLQHPSNDVDEDATKSAANNGDNLAHDALH